MHFASEVSVVSPADPSLHGVLRGIVVGGFRGLLHLKSRTGHLKGQWADERPKVLTGQCLHMVFM